MTRTELDRQIITYCPRCRRADFHTQLDTGIFSCDRCRATRKAIPAAQRNADRRARHQALLDLGLVRVRGNMGGTYYE